MKVICPIRLLELKYLKQDIHDSFLQAEGHSIILDPQVKNATKLKGPVYFIVA